MTDEKAKPKQEEQADLELSEQDADAVKGGASPRSPGPKAPSPKTNIRPRAVKGGPRPL